MTVLCCECGAEMTVRDRGRRPLRCPPCLRERRRTASLAYWHRRYPATRPRSMPREVVNVPPPVRQCADCRATIAHPHGPQRYCGLCAANREVARDRLRKQQAAARKREASGKVAPVFSHPKVSDGEFLKRVALAEARERAAEEARLARLTRRCDCGGLIRQGVVHNCQRSA